MTAALQRIPLLARRALEQAIRLDGARRSFPVAVVVAVSGGPDSIALLDVLSSLDPRLSLAVAHFNHGLRGAESDGDEAAVQNAAGARGLAFYRERAEGLRGAGARRGESLEMAARSARYAFLARVARDTGADWVATAHHADDQAETVLLRLLRGSGAAGLSGMRTLAPLPGDGGLRVWRPLLRATRAEIEAYCAQRGLATRQDQSNDDQSILRNRIRHELLPILETYNPGVRKVLARVAENAATDADVVETAARSALEALRRSGGAFDRAAFRELAPGLQRATLRALCAEASGDLEDVKAAGIEEAIAALDAPAHSAEVALSPAIVVQIAGSLFQLQARRAADD